MGTISLTRNEVDAITIVVWIAGAIVVGTIVHRVLAYFLNRWARDARRPYLPAIVRRTERPAAYILPLLLILFVLPTLATPEAWNDIIEHITGMLTISAVAWALIALIRLYADIAIARHRTDVDDNLAARQLGTRLDILTRVSVITVIIVAVGSILMTFPPIRALGTTLLASAGVAGIAIGIAARPLFENLVAGVQLAFTQPIRLDDVVIVEKQYGRIEEIHSTYVVIRLWDLRRMVVPLTYFINTPFENWTRQTANLMGEVHLYTDFTFDVPALRAALPEIVKAQPLWDGKFWNCQVNDSTNAGLDVRILVTAKNSGELADLRAAVREAAYAWIVAHQPHALPMQRQISFSRDQAQQAAPAPTNGARYAPTVAGPADIPKVGGDGGGEHGEESAVTKSEAGQVSNPRG
jgi:small-conductance mechanosensitive channel